MENFPEIITTDIVSSRWDAFWTDQTGKLDSLKEAITLVISTPFAAGSAEQSQLEKLLAACKIEQQQVQILQLSGEEELAWHLIREQVKPKHVILLGVTPGQLGILIQFMPHQVSRFNECSFVQTVSLEDLQRQPEIKTHVWNYGLKPVFIEKVYG
ncbi:MAG: hypothetical protein EOP49_19195 [Sphingobacteriales bacterium]|nr:MAG: hypothetical protein EOP49_19195 [Sphingobacteriales bacterium]